MLLQAYPDRATVALSCSKTFSWLRVSVPEKGVKRATGRVVSFAATRRAGQSHHPLVRPDYGSPVPKPVSGAQEYRVGLWDRVETNTSQLHR